ncbi:hypothetical protein E2C01_054776 [Portunus trituberculatus]|uniref:Uncharacterized protein n=1 Tax=Portunus trituberculatus TaxID=210409 RepID=A0A5B7GKJ2_PORTR|nr:hypothetical protein [Portunus trituberculatus]
MEERRMGRKTDKIREDNHERGSVPELHNRCVASQVSAAMWRPVIAARITPRKLQQSVPVTSPCPGKTGENRGGTEIMLFSPNQ